MRHPGLLVVSYGGGVDSVAMLIRLNQLGERPSAILMADPGSEWPGTMRYLDEFTQPRLRKWDFPAVTLISRKEEGLHRPKAWRLESLREECLRIGSIPSVAYGFKKCSQKYKGEPQRWWQARQPWAQEEWAAGRKLVKAIGYDYDERSRVEVGQAFNNKWEEARFASWYPLYEARLTRDDCEELIRSERMPVPPKSACTFCPNNTLAEWKKLRADEPAKFAEAVAMSRNAAANIESPDVVGLMRCNQHGRRQLHHWADGDYDSLGPLFDWDVPMPCGCAT